MNPALLLGISLFLNLVLLAVHIRNFREPTARRTENHLTNSQPENSGSTTSPAPPRNSTKQPAASLQRASWRDLESDDLRKYAFNLRSAGFPEPIVQRIIIAKLDRHLASEKAALKRPADTNYWKTGPQRDEAQRQQRAAEKLFAKRREAKITELLGNKWHEASTVRDGDSIWAMIYSTGVMDEDGPEKLNALSRVAAKISDASREFGSDEFQTAESEAQRRQAYDELMGELRQILGPAGFEEFQLRTMAFEMMDVWGAERLFGCIMTGAELREFLRIRKDTALPAAEDFKLEAPKPTAEMKQRIEEQTRALLGEERYGGYLRAKEGGFKGIRSELADEPMELTWAVYDIYAGLKKETDPVREAVAGSKEETAATLRRMRASAEEQLRKTLGPEKFEQYAGKGPGSFRWLKELTEVK